MRPPTAAGLLAHPLADQVLTARTRDLLTAIDQGELSSISAVATRLAQIEEQFTEGGRAPAPAGTDAEDGLELVAVPGGARQAIAACHAMGAPRNAAEHQTAAALLGLPLDHPDAHGITLADRIDGYWQALAERGVRAH